MVEPLLDGDMGSFRFCSADIGNVDRRFGKAVIRGEFSDADGMGVLFSVNVDETGGLFELDLWRGDFNPLIRLPLDDENITIEAST